MAGSTRLRYFAASTQGKHGSTRLKHFTAQLLRLRLRLPGLGDATARRRFFRDNFIFRRRSKRIAFLESVNFSTCV